MKIEKMKKYICEYCGKSFIDDYDCIEHERICRKMQNRKTCPRCHGTGRAICGYTDGEYLGDGYYKKVPEYHICHTCNGRGWINKNVYN